MNRDICRICLKKGILTNIFSEDKWAPSVMIMECTTVKLSKEEMLPSLICQDCLNNLKIAFQFKRLCESSDYQLRKTYINTNVPPDRSVSVWIEGCQDEGRENKFIYNYYERPFQTTNVQQQHMNIAPTSSFKAERSYVDNNYQDNNINTALQTFNNKPFNHPEDVKMAKSGNPKGKKKERNPHLWKSHVRKERREKGLEYEDVNKKIHPARSVKGGCGQHCRYNCMKKFSNEDRLAIFDNFYQLSDERKTYFFNKFTARDTPSRKRTKAEKSRKAYVFKYSLLLKNIKVQVCKTFFCNTLDISQSRIYYFHDKILDNDTMIPRSSLKGRNVKKVTPLQDLEIIRSHIRSFPIVEAHYCQRMSGKNYLDASLSVEKMYSLYCSQTEKPVSKYVYRSVFKKDFNLAFQKPKKDRCEACDKLKFQPLSNQMCYSVRQQ